MQKLSPSQVRRPPLTPTSYEGANVEAGYFAKCLPFTFAATISVAIVAFDLITDWLSYRKFSQLDFSGRVLYSRELDDWTFWGMVTFFSRIPNVYLALCVIATIVAVVDIARWILIFSSQRKRFKEKVDGLSYKENCFEKYGGEVTLVFQCILQDLAISCILLAVQAAIGCTFVIKFNSAIFGLSMIATCVSVIWKICQVVWRAGCLGKRQHYNQNVPLIALRIFTVLFLVFTLAIVVLNLLIFISRHQNYKGGVIHTALFDKVGMDRWIDEDHLVLAYRKKGPNNHHIDNRPDERTDINYRFVNIVRLKDVTDNQMSLEQSLLVHKTCESMRDKNGIDVYDFFHNQHKIPREFVANCSVFFHFSFSAEQKRVMYNFMYSYRNEQTGECLASHFPRIIEEWEEVSDAIGQLRNGTNGSSSEGNATSASDVSRSPGNSTIGTIYVPPDKPPSDKMVFTYKYLKLGYLPDAADKSRWVRCMFEMTMNTTMLPLSPCATVDQ